jgi:3-keto-disaccharide hydrolase
MTAHLRLMAAFCVLAAQPLLANGPAYTDPDKTDADFAYQGEYVGAVQTNSGEQKIGVQVIALGAGKFHAVGYHGGLPGDGWDKTARRESDGEMKGGAVVFSGERVTTTIKGRTMTLVTKEGREFGKLEKTERKSSSLGAKPPAEAIVLFDGSSADAFTGGKTTDDGLLMAGCTSKQKFGSCRVHIEFRLPYMPEDRGQARGNSGIYLQGRYEVQMLDSFGLEGKNNECGGLYELKDPDVNMCLPPLVWQAYDIDYMAAKYDGEKVIAPPRITVEHNGVVIHKDVELPTDRGTRAAPVKPGPERGPIYLQDHGNPVRYRNIWVVEK